MHRVVYVLHVLSMQWCFRTSHFPFAPVFLETVALFSFEAVVLCFVDKKMLLVLHFFKKAKTFSCCKLAADVNCYIIVACVHLAAYA